MIHYLHTSNDDRPSQRILDAVSRGEWTEGGMAEAGWFLVGHDPTGGPIFSRTTNPVTIKEIP